MSPDRFTHSVHVQAPPERAWGVLQEPETWGAIAGVERIFEAHHHPDGTLQSYKFLAAAGPRLYEGKAQTLQADAPLLMVVVVDTPEVEGTITTQLTPHNPHGVDLTVSLKLRPRGLLGTVVYPLVAQAVGSGFAEQVDKLAERIERR